MKVFAAKYSKNTSCNCHPEYDERHRVVCGETQAHALGLLLHGEDCTKADDWDMEEIDISEYGVYCFY